jgi:AcrR family transcriptional regulator
MTPRPYTPVQRQAAVDAGRERILAAARELLEVDDAERFSLDAVARRAGVSRMTVYNQFESKAKLLESLFDSLSQRGPISEMRSVFANRDPFVTLDAFINLFGRFWTYSRRAHGRLRAAAADDAELDAALQKRQGRRRGAVTEVVRRLSPHVTPVVPHTELVDVLFVMLSFETFDAIAGPDRTPNDVVPIVTRMVHAILGIAPAKPRARRKNPPRHV